MVPFENLRAFFADESEYGQLCDIVAPDAGREAWQLFVDVVVRRHRHTFCLVTAAGELLVRPLPEDVDEVWNLINSEEGPWPSLEIELEGLAVRVLMSLPDWLELDVARGEITEERYTLLTELMREMGEAMGHDVFMTPESRPDDGHVVYAVAEKRFRRPRHGEATDGVLWREFVAGARAAVEPLLRFTPEDGMRAHRERAEEVEGMLAAAYDRIVAVEASATELRKQDELTVEQRRLVESAWQGVAMLVRPAAGVEPKADREFWWAEAIKMAQALMMAV